MLKIILLILHLTFILSLKVSHVKKSRTTKSLQHVSNLYSRRMNLHAVATNIRSSSFGGSNFEQNSNIIRKSGPSASQRNAIISDDESLMVVAGPGSGKTRVLSARMSHLLESGACSGDEILVLSHTNNAAKNIKTRTHRLLENSLATTNGVTCNTFHSLCASILRSYISIMSKRQDLLIADDSDQMNIMMSLLESRGLPTSSSTASNILKQIRYWKELGLGYLGVRKKSLKTWTEQRAYDLYPEYQSKLREKRTKRPLLGSQEAVVERLFLPTGTGAARASSYARYANEYRRGMSAGSSSVHCTAFIKMVVVRACAGWG